MKKIYKALIFLYCFLPKTGQAQIAADGLNNTTTLFTIAGTGAYFTGNSSAVDGPGSSPFAVEGTHSRGITNGTETLTSSVINTTSYTGVSASFRLASFSIGGTGNGADGTDIVTVEISPDGGTNFYSTIRVLGAAAGNAYWAYAATGSATTPYDGNINPIDFQPAGSGSRSTDGYSTVTITNLPSITNLIIRITLLNNSTSERWVIDDFTVSGTLSCSVPAAPVAIAATSVGFNDFTANWNPVAGANGYSIDVYNLVANSKVAEWTFPTNGTTVTPSTASANNTLKTLTENTAGTIIDAVGATTKAPSVDNWNSGTGIKAWQITVDATGFYNLTLSSKQKSSNSGPRDFKIQYKLSAASAWTDVTGGAVPPVLNDAFVSGVINILSLPPACDNQATVYIQWVMTSNTSADGSTVAGGGTSRIDDITVEGDAKTFVPGYQDFSTTNTSEDIAGLSPSTNYYYVVRANNPCGSSANSNEISVVTGTPCTIASISSFSPATGPAGTIVTITGATFTGATAVNFGTVPAISFTVISDVKIIAEVPAGTTTNLLNVTVGGCTTYSATNYTPILQTVNCNSAAGIASDLFISEVYDAYSGSLSYIEIFNGTAASIDLGTGNYVLRIITGTNTIADVALSGTVASGATYLVRLGTSTSACTGLIIGSDNPASSGFNGNDRIYLRKNAVDIDYVPNPNYPGTATPGFSQSRKATAIGPSTTYNANDWLVSTTENCSDLGIAPYSLTGSSITVDTQPQDENDCSAISFITSATSTPATPNYLWKYYNSAIGTWDNASGIAGVTTTGSNTNNLTITGNTASIIDYQFYCEISKNTCTLATNTVQFTYTTRPYYRSKSTGNWTNPAIWEMSNSASDWTGAISTCQYPTKQNSSGVFIESPTVVTQDIDIDIDYLEIKPAATLITTLNAKLTVSDSTIGTDFLVNGTWNYDANGTNSFGFDIATGTWQLGANATIIKTSDGSAATLRDFYQGGMAAIPATANWIIRYIGANDVNFTTTGGTFYPNLAFESNGGAWVPIASSSRFTGNTGYATVKGNLDIGGSGTGTVIIVNENTNAQPLLINGNLEVKLSNTLTTAGAANGTGFEVKGNITVSGIVTIISNNTGLLKLSGTTNQTISGAGTINLQDVTAANTGAVILLNKDITIPGVLTMADGANLNLNTGNITLKSSTLATARVAPINTGIIAYGTGQFIIERNVAALRSWRLLTAPVVSTQTLSAAWMEGALPSTTIPLFNEDPFPGYGVHISGPSPTVNGFDETPLNNYSVKYFNGTAWTGTGILPATTLITSKPGWMLFVRGGRDYPISTTTVGTTPQTTTLRTKGTINIGTMPIITPSGFTIIGNPYASAINFSSVTKAGLGDVYYLWDPRITSGTTSTTVGGWITLTRSTGNTYTAAPLPVTAAIDLTAGRIESGAAFMVNSSNITSLNFKETDKATASSLVFRHAKAAESRSLRVNLYVKNGDSTLAIFDGVLHLFDKSFSNIVDGSDALKQKGFAENIAIASHDSLLAIEKRNTPTYRDTLFYILKQLKLRNYALEFIAENMAKNNLAGYIEDNFLQTSTPLNMESSTTVDFSVTNDSGSYAANRFRVVFRHLEEGKEEELYVAKSKIVQLERVKKSSDIFIFPNPVTGNTIHLQMNHLPEGTYQAKLVNNAGQIMGNYQLYHAGGTTVLELKKINNFLKGTYQLIITSPEKRITSLKLLKR